MGKGNRPGALWAEKTRGSEAVDARGKKFRRQRDSEKLPKALDRDLP